MIPSQRRSLPLIRSLLLIGILLFSVLLWGQDYSPGETRAFAAYLEDLEEWEMAYGEYQRLLFFSSSQGQKQEIHRKLASMALRLEDFSLGSYHFRQSGDPLLGDLFLYRSQGPLTSEATSLPRVKAFLMRDWDKALENPEEGFPHELVIPLAREGQDYRKKNPWIAGVLNTLVPGLGRVYNGGVYEGFLNAFMVGSLGYLAYDLYHKGGPEDPVFLLASAGSATFYVAGITGSYFDARRRNDYYYETLDRRFWEQVDERLLP